MLKFGLISEVDATTGLAKVNFDQEGIVSGWLPMLQPKTKLDQFVIPFDINEHVVCLMDDRLEHGVILGAIYDSKNKPTGADNKKIRVQFVQGLCVEYDRDSKTLTLNGEGHFTVDISGNVTVNCDKAVINSLTDAEISAVTEIKLTAPVVTVSGELSAAAITTTGSGNITAGGTLQGAVVKQGLIELGTHKHTGVTTGGGTSGTPTP